MTDNTNTIPDTLIVYHFPCLDGFTAAWAAHKRFGDDAEYRPMNYGQENLTLDDITGRDVYLLDFSLKKEVIREYAKYAHRIIILDHHKTAQEDIEPLIAEGTIEGVFDMSRSGALLTWDYFFPEEEPPAFVEYVSDRDLWQFKLPRCKEVNAAMFSYPYSFTTWDDFHIKGPFLLAQEGETLRRQFLKDVSEIRENTERRMNIAGYDVPVINANHMFGSEACSQMAEGEKFAAYYWTNKNGEYVFGLRSTFESGFDVAAIAQLFGGGGHKTASGFRVKSLDEVAR